VKPRDVWIRIATFVGVTYGVSSIFMYMVISTGEITALAALGGMWSPLVGVFVTRLIFPDGRRRGSLAGLGWGWGKTRYQLLSYVVPILYVLAAYIVVWVAGIGEVTDLPAGRLAVWILKQAATGLVLASIFAFGEEVGWQGFLVPQLFKITDFTKTALLRGIIWSVWHYPLLLGGVYGPTDTPAWYRLVCFTITMTAASFAFAWIGLRSGSLWTGVWMHASHNEYIQGIFPGITEGGPTINWFVDEMGVFTAVAAVIVAFVFWRKRGELRAREPH
jgi:membrane protease YdiL (CAAX protease family)